MSVILLFSRAASSDPERTLEGGGSLTLVGGGEISAGIRAAGGGTLVLAGSGEISAVIRATGGGTLALTGGGELSAIESLELAGGGSMVLIGGGAGSADVCVEGGGQFAIFGGGSLDQIAAPAEPAQSGGGLGNGRTRPIQFPRSYSPFIPLPRDPAQVSGGSLLELVGGGRVRITQHQQPAKDLQGPTPRTRSYSDVEETALALLMVA